MSKRPFNMSFGGGNNPLSKPNPFSRPMGGGKPRADLGFEDDEDDNHPVKGSSLTSTEPPQRKQPRLDRNPLGGDDDDDEYGLNAFNPNSRPKLGFGGSKSGNKDEDEDDAFSRLASKASSAPKGGPPQRAVEDDDDVFSRLASKKDDSKDSKGKNKAEEDRQQKQQGQQAADADDDFDPLDAFMAGIDTQVKKEAEKPSEEKVQRETLEEEDHVESYIRHMKKKGITVGQGGSSHERNEDVDSDEEVYATARAIDGAMDQRPDPEDVEFDPTVKKEITPLPRMDHSRQNYIEVEKCFYEEHEDIAKLSPDQVVQVRRELDMRVSGADVAKPCISFAHFGFGEELMETIRRVGYTEPSGIQRQAIPVALSGRDIIGIAKTGSGKTAAFLLPMIVHIMDQQELNKGDGPIGVVIAPTRELADQIYSEARRFGKSYGLRVAVVYGGASKQDQFKTLRAGVEIVVATPGRLIDMIKIKATNFKRASYLVLDEADRVLDLGFEPQVRSICDNIRPDRQTLLFSATFQKRIERLAREVMSDPVRITIGNVGQINTDVTQIIQVLKDDGLKWNWLMERLQGFEAQGSVLVFVSRKNGVVELTENLKKSGVHCECLHGDMMQQERDKAIHDFKSRVFPILIATDVVARGLDIKSVRNVVNFDVARDIDSHVHRVGRTGRAGEKGTAYTLITEKEDRFAGDLVRNLEESSQAVPDEVMKIAMQNPRFRKSRQFMGGHHDGRGRGRGRGGQGGQGGRGRGGGRGGGGGGGGGGGRFQPYGHEQERPFSSSSNNIPLGQGSRGDRRQQGSESSGARTGDSFRPSSGYRVSGFQKASRPETGAAESASHSSDAARSGQGDNNGQVTRPPPAQAPSVPTAPNPSHAQPAHAMTQPSPGTGTLARPPWQPSPSPGSLARPLPPPGYPPFRPPPPPHMAPPPPGFAFPPLPPPPGHQGGPYPGHPYPGMPHPPPPGMAVPPPPGQGSFRPYPIPPRPPGSNGQYIPGAHPPPHSSAGQEADRRRRWDR